MSAKFYDLWAVPEPKPASGPSAAPGTATAYALRALEGELDQLGSAPEGQRNDQLNRSAFNLAQLVRAGHLDRAATWTLLSDTAQRIGLNVHETYATLTSAFRAAPPRDVPELDAVPEATVYTAPDTDPGEELRKRFKPIDWYELWADDSEEEWIVQPILPARRHVALFSAPKVGKSLLLLELAVAIANGQDVLGTKLDRARRVLYVDFENDPRGDIRTRLVAMGRKPADLENLVYLSYPPFMPLDSAQGSAELLAACAEFDVELVVIDTVSRTVNGEENDNDTWIKFYRHTGLALKQAEIACIRLDHTGKDPAKGMRGGSAKYGDVDAVWAMTRLNETTFRLECTANRMQVTEKILLLERKLDPLSHAVTTRSTGDVLRDEVDAHVAELDRLGVPEDAGRDRCHAALLKAKFIVNDRRLRDAIKQRKDRAGLLTLVDPDEDDLDEGPSRYPSRFGDT